MLSEIFNNAVKKLQATLTGRRRQPFEEDYFRDYLYITFADNDTRYKIIEILNRLQLPIPRSKKEFLPSTEGALIFSNYYGVVIRIEQKIPKFKPRISQPNIQRVNDNPWIIKPLGTFDAGNAVIEICPGCHATDDMKITEQLYSDLRSTGINFWDCGSRNVGLLPIKTPSFLQGIPVVIDRSAVSGLTNSVSEIKAALEKIGLPQDPQELLYAPLRAALAEAWPDPEKPAAPDKMQAFWQMCRQYAEEGKCVAGWNEKCRPDDIVKKTAAASAARRFDRKIEAAQKSGTQPLEKPALAFPRK